MKIKNQKVKITLLIVIVTVLGLLSYANKVFAAALGGGSVTLSDSQPSGSSVSYTIDFSNVTNSAVKCIRVEFDAEADGSGAKPTGMNITSAALGGTSDYIPTPASWTPSNNNTTGVIEITYASGETPASADNRTIVLTGITNGSVVDTGYYALVNTYNNTDCSSDAVDSGVATFIYTSGQAVSLTVDPSISFALSAVAVGQSVNGTDVTVETTTSTIPFSTVTDTANAVAAHIATVSTNASNGYFLYARYTGKPTYDTNDIDDHSGSHASPSVMSAGTEAFGYTTEDTDYSDFQTNKYAAFTDTNAEVAKSTTAVSNDATKIGYQVGVSGNTKAGTYVTTVILTCIPFY